MEPDHLSRIETGEEPTNLEEGLLDAQLFSVCVANNHFADIIHFLTIGTNPEGIESTEEIIGGVHGRFFGNCGPFV